eukprot:TRINITY_DN604_c0_g1_i1.p1 TRINITY_DN604_c0_g1~~TRINITY_DN604_c0_g1_i1.p1  ORF type:complete len:350 (+),score=56.95 TRINITY_DN604_c0_g1_i1:76-1125(+)
MNSPKYAKIHLSSPSQNANSGAVAHSRLRTPMKSLESLVRPNFVKKEAFSQAIRSSEKQIEARSALDVLPIAADIITKEAAAVVSRVKAESDIEVRDAKSRLMDEILLRKQLQLRLSKAETSLSKYLTDPQAVLDDAANQAQLRIKSLEAQLREKQDDIDYKVEVIDTLRDTLGAASIGQPENAAHLVFKMQSLCGQLEQRCERLTAELSRLRSQNPDLYLNVDSTDEQSLASECARLREQASQLSSDLRSAERTTLQLRLFKAEAEETTKLEREKRAAMELELESKEQTVSRNRVQLSELTRRCIQQDQAIAALRRHGTDVETRLHEQIAQLKAALLASEEQLGRGKR